MRERAGIGVLLLLFGFAGCASVDLTAGFPEVKATVAERAAAGIAWDRGVALDREAAERLDALLQRRLTADDAVAIALLGNRDLQAMYSALGVAQADLVQAGLLRNPILDASVAFHLGPVRPDLQLGMVFGVLDALYVPLRKRVAAARFEEAKLGVTGAILDFVREVRTTFHEYQADEQMLELRLTVVDALGASFEVSQRLHRAGNITDLDLARDRAAVARSRLDLRGAEVVARQSRERLNDLMGLWGTRTGWAVEPRLPDVPADPLPVNDLERVAVTRSLDLARARQGMVSAGQQLGFDRATALMPSLELGAAAEKESDEVWGIGPSVAVRVPIFDQGQARVARGAAELRRAHQGHHALAVRVRAVARAVRDRVQGAADRALYYRDIVLPLQERIVGEAQLQYNAMQVGVFELLRERQHQIEAGVAYVEALRDYWVARTDLLHVLSGRLPRAEGVPQGTRGERSPARENGNGE